MSNNYFEDTPSMLTDGANCDFETNPADISYDGKMFDNNFVSSEQLQQTEGDCCEDGELKKEDLEGTLKSLMRKTKQTSNSDDALNPADYSKDMVRRIPSPLARQDLELKKVLMSEDIAFIK